MSKLADKKFYPITARTPTGGTVKLTVRRDLSVEMDLDLELREQPGLFSWYASLRAVAKKDLEHAKLYKQEVYDKLFVQELRERQGPKRVLKGDIEAAIRAKTQYKQAQEAVIDREFDLERLDGVIEAFKQRSYKLGDLAKLRRRGDSDLPDDVSDEEEN